MSKSYSSWDCVAIAVVSIFLGLVAFAFTQSIFNLLFVPPIVAILWNYTDKVKSLEERLSQIEVRLASNTSGDGARASYDRNPYLTDSIGQSRSTRGGTLDHPVRLTNKTWKTPPSLLPT